MKCITMYKYDDLMISKCREYYITKNYLQLG